LGRRWKLGTERRGGKQTRSSFHGHVVRGVRIEREGGGEYELRGGMKRLRIIPGGLLEERGQAWEGRKERLRRTGVMQE